MADYSVDSDWNALAAPAGTPAAAIERIRAAATQALAQPAVVERLREFGVKASQPRAEQARLLADEIQHWGRVGACGEDRARE